MSSWSDLPAEILDYIFRQGCLIEPNVLQYGLVCKSWNRAVNIKLYREVNIRGHSKLVHFLECMKSSQLGELVNTFVISPPAYEGKGIDYMQQLGAVCPNVQKFDCIVHFSDMWKALSSVSHWKLKRLPDPKPRENQDYYICALHYRQTLTYLCLPEYFPTDPTFRWFVRHLNKFTQLSHLDIQTSYLEQSLMDYDPITQHARRLTSLKIGEHDFCLKLISDLPCDGPGSKIRELKVSIKYYPGTVHYLIQKFPSLKNLTLTFEGRNAEMAKLLQACFLRIGPSFVDYLRRIRHYTVDMVCTRALVSAYFKGNPKSTLSFQKLPTPTHYSRLVLEPDIATIDCSLEHVKKWSSRHVLSVSLSVPCSSDIEQWIQEISTCFPRLKALKCNLYKIESRTASFASGLFKSLQKLSLYLIVKVQNVYIDSSRFSSLQYITLDILSYDKRLSFNLSGLSLQLLQLRLHRRVHSLQDDGEIYLQMKTNEARVKSFTFKPEGNSFKVIRGYKSKLLSLRIDLGCFAIDCFSLSLGIIQRSNQEQWKCTIFRDYSLNF